MSVKLKCQCCHFEQTFEDSEAAFQAGWDAPPHFSTHIVCSLCPAGCSLGMDTHLKAHAHWQEHGRPDDFNLLCLPDKDFGKSQDFLDYTIQSGKKLAEEIIKEIRK